MMVLSCLPDTGFLKHPPSCVKAFAACPCPSLQSISSFMLVELIERYNIDPEAVEQLGQILSKLLYSLISPPSSFPSSCLRALLKLSVCLRFLKSTIMMPIATHTLDLWINKGRISYLNSLSLLDEKRT